MQRPLPTDPFALMVALARFGVWSPTLIESRSAHEIVASVVRFQASLAMTPHGVASAWKVKDGRFAGSSQITPCWLAPRPAGDVLLIRANDLLVCGPLRVSGGPVLMPTPNQRDTTRTLSRSAQKAPHLDNAFYLLRFRPPGFRPADLGLAQYSELVVPIVQAT